MFLLPTKCSTIHFLPESSSLGTAFTSDVGPPGRKMYNIEVKNKIFDSKKIPGDKAAWYKIDEYLPTNM
jgi:hypothetical protein